MAQIFGVEMGDVALPGQGMFAGVGANTLQAVIWLAVICGLGIVGWLFYVNSKYKYKIEIYENLGGTGYVKSGVDKARLLRLGDGGEMIIKLKKRKVIRSAYARKMGHNLIWFAVGQDGYWYNVVLGDLDAKQGMLDIEPIDRDMRYMHVAIRKNIQDRYRKQNFMDKYGGWLIAGIFMIIMLLGVWFLISKMGDTADALALGQQTSIELMRAQKDILGQLSNLMSNSGVTPA